MCYADDTQNGIVRSDRDPASGDTIDDLLYLWPVLPNPPAPRALNGKSSTIWNAARAIGKIMSCAIRSNG
jgi:hypothetical protein